MFRGGVIAQRVMEVIKARIEAGQRRYEEECERIDAEAFQKKANMADKIVTDIVGE